MHDEIYVPRDMPKRIASILSRIYSAGTYDLWYLKTYLFNPP